MALNAVQLANLNLSVLNALDMTTYTTYGVGATINDNERHALLEAFDALVEADGDVVRLILETPGHGQKALYLTTQANIANGAALSARIGQVDSVHCVITGGLAPGEYPCGKAGKMEITYENRNPGQGLSIWWEPHYNVEGTTLWHNGAYLLSRLGAASVSFNAKLFTYTAATGYTVNAPPQLFAPDEYANAVRAKALGMMFPKEGNHVQGGQFFEEVYKGYTDEIMRNVQQLGNFPTQEAIEAGVRGQGAGAGQSVGAMMNPGGQ